MKNINVITKKNILLTLATVFMLSAGSQIFGMDIWLAAKTGDKTRIEELLKGKNEQGKKELVNQVDNNGLTPLAIACANGHTEIAKLLLENGANVNAVTTDGYYKGRTPLLFACANGQTETAKLLLEKGANINAALTDGYYKGSTPLHWACENGSTEVVKLLIENGANVNAIVTNGYYKGWTPLHLACEYCYAEIVKLLLENGANVNAAVTDGDYKDWTPLHLACVRGQTETAKLLIEKGADVNLADNDGWTPLHFACANGQTEIVKLLIENGANIYAAVDGYYKGWTPLHLACENGSTEVVKLLIENGANVNIIITAEGEFQGQTARDITANKLARTNDQELQQKYQSILQLLDLTRDYDNTPDKLQFILDHRRQLNITEFTFMGPLAVNEEIFQFLIKLAFGRSLKKAEINTIESTIFGKLYNHPAFGPNNLTTILQITPVLTEKDILSFTKKVARECSFFLPKDFMPKHRAGNNIINKENNKKLFGLGGGFIEDEEKNTEEEKKKTEGEKEKCEKSEKDEKKKCKMFTDSSIVKIKFD